jgi:autotransporter-associated beta strand protein
MLDDSASGSTVINLNSTVSPAGIAVVTVTNIIPNVSTNIVVTTNNPGMIPGIVVSNALKNYTIAGVGKLSGMTGLYKAGSGTLTVLTTNDFTGNTWLVGGVTAVSNLLSLGVNGNANGTRGANNQVFMDGATLRYLGAANANLVRVTYINNGGATFEVVSSTNELTVNQNAIGSGSLTKIGPGSLQLNQTGDLYAGGTFINEGTVRITGNTMGTGTATIGNATLFFSSGPFTLNNAISILGSSSRIISSNNYISGGAWSGGGTVAVTISNTTMFTLNTNITGFTGTISLGNSPGNLRFNSGTTNNNFCRGSTAALFDLGTGSGTLSNANGNALSYDLGALAGGASTILGGRSTNNTFSAAGTTYSIGGNNNNSTFSGKIMNGLDTVSIVKVGSGALLLNGVSTYSGSTTVSNGILGGSGSIASPLTVISGATLSPGGSIGTFTVSNSATLGGTVLLELNQASSPANDKLVVTGTITATGGTLLVTNIGPNIRNGTKFQLFNKAVSGFATVSLPPTDPTATFTYVWANNLGTDGSITLSSGGAPPVNSNPTNITVTASGSTLILSWPQDHIGWSLSSNAVSLLNSNAWFPVPGSEITNQQFLNMDPSKTNGVFFRMFLQLP